MNPNSYAYLIDTVHTINVRFYGERGYESRNVADGKDYTYLSDRAYQEGEHVIVDVSGIPRAVLVTSCDVGVPLDNPKELKWVVGPAYTQEHFDFHKKIQTLKANVAHVYATSAKKRMKDVMLQEIGVSSVEELLLLDKPTA